MSCCTLQELTEKVPFIPEIIGDYADDTDLLDGGGSGGPGNTTVVCKKVQKIWSVCSKMALGEVGVSLP